MNISEIKDATKESSPYFFSPDTLEWFGQTVESFKVKTVKGRVFIYAPSYRLFGKYMGRLMGYTFREYKDGQLLMVRNHGGGSMVDHHTLEDVKAYFELLEKELSK